MILSLSPIQREELAKCLLTLTVFLGASKNERSIKGSVLFRTSNDPKAQNNDKKRAMIVLFGPFDHFSLAWKIPDAQRGAT